MSEAQTRLQSFQGASAISSNQYFGRDEEDENEFGARGEGVLGDGSLSGLETAARDALQRVMANPDVQNVGENIRAGALKVCNACILGPPYTSSSSLAVRLSCPDVGGSMNTQFYTLDTRTRSWNIIDAITLRTIPVVASGGPDEVNTFAGHCQG